MWNESLRQHEGAEMIGGARHIPPASVLRGTQLHDARIVDQTREWKSQTDDLSSRAFHALNIRKVANDRFSMLTLLLDFPL